MREARRVSRREGERDVPRDERESDERRGFTNERETRERDARERRRERERVERERERERESTRECDWLVRVLI